ncbi:suppressor of fused homolog [Argonauta hians]
MNERSNGTEMEAEKDNGDDGGRVDGLCNDTDAHYDGLLAVDLACTHLYPEQPTPMQAAALQKFWLGGPDPLDYISIYNNDGNQQHNIPPHWHYITYGFSDLYGDNRVHQFTGPGKLSGFGFELTLRLKKRGSDESEPPMWPAALLNKLALYVFQTGNILDVGDHIPWHKSLDDDSHSKSTIRHMLITEDPELTLLDTNYGTLEFRQVLGVTDDEMKSAQHWQGAGILELLKESKGVGSYYITDMEREKSLFEEKPELIKFVSEGIKNDGSNLGHVTAVCCWAEIIKREDRNSMDGANGETSKTLVTEKEKKKEEGKEKEEEKKEEKVEGRGDKEGVRIVCEGEEEDDDEEEHEPVRVIKEVQLMFDVEAAELLPVVVKGRLKKGRFFVFHSGDDHVIHLVPNLTSQEHTFVTEEEPIKAEGDYLQIYCPANLIERIEKEVQIFEHLDKGLPQLPVVFQFENPNIFITITDCIDTTKEDEDETQHQHQHHQQQQQDEQQDKAKQ